MAELQVLLDRIKTQVFLRGIMPAEWFRDFDKLRSGRVTKQQFRRCFVDLKFPLSDEEFEMLSNEYGEKDLMNYGRFVENVNTIYSNKDLEKNPLQTVQDPRETLKRTLGALENLNDPRLEELLMNMAHQSRTKGVHIREAFMDFDRHNNGNVTRTQFLRCFPFNNFVESDKEYIADHYQDPKLKDINYRHMINDVNGFMQKNQQESLSKSSTLHSHQIQQLRINETPSQTQDLKTKFATSVREQRIRILDFFKAHDPLNKGTITRSKFQRTMSTFGILFTQKDLDFLSDEYAQKIDFTDYVRYREFCSDIDNLASMQTQTRETEITNNAIEPILEKVRDTVNRYRMNVLPSLQDFDRSGRGFITPNQFFRALSSLKIFITQADLEVITGIYNRSGGIDYYRFIEDIDSGHNQKRREFRPLGTDKQSIIDIYGQTPSGDRFLTQEEAEEMIHTSKKGIMLKTSEKTDIQSLMEDLKRWSYINSIHLHDFMSDFDRHKWGEIPSNQFRSAMTMSQYKLSDTEFELILNEYSSPTRQGFIQWKRFADDVLSVIAPKGLEVKPTETPLDPRVTTLLRTTEVEQPPEIRSILEKVARHVKSRRVSLLEHFKDKDRVNHKMVTAIGFSQIIQLIEIRISKPEIDQLCAFYSDISHKFVNYVKFVEDVDRITGRIFGDRASSSIVINPIPSYGAQESPYLVSRKMTSGHVETWDEIKARLQTFVFKRRIRLQEFFQAFDELRRGQVTKQKFRTVVGQTNLPLNAEQIDTIIARFELIEEMFNYRAFCAEVNTIFGRTELNKLPTDRETFSQTSPLPDPSSTLQQLGTREQEELNQVLERMKTKVVTRRMNIHEQFEDYDKFPHKNYITKQQFKQSIARLGLTTDPMEFDLLCKKYRCTDLDDMNYMAFCRDIE